MNSATHQNLDSIIEQLPLAANKVFILPGLVYQQIADLLLNNIPCRHNTIMVTVLDILRRQELTPEALRETLLSIQSNFPSENV